MKNILEKELSDWLAKDSQIDISKLPEFTARCLDFLSKLSPRAPKEMLLLIINAKLSEAFNYYRIKVKSQSFECPANVYWITFAMSSAGKNRNTKALEKHILKNYIKTYEKDQKLIKDQLTEKVKKEAEEKFTHKGSISKHVNDNSPRWISRVIQKWNMPALMACRQQLEKINIWSTLVYLDEFAHYIWAMDGDKGSFISIIFSIYDSWDYWGEILRWQKETGETYWIPNTILFMTDPNWLLRWEGRERLMTFLNQWLARRSLICFPDSLWEVEEDKVDNIEDLRRLFKKKAEVEQETINWAVDIRYEFDKMFKSIAWEFKIAEGKVNYSHSTFEFDEDAYLYYQMYQAYCVRRSDEFWNKEWYSWYLAELEWRAWKMVKLAGIIACQNHCNEKKVYKKDILQAIYQVEMFWLHFQKFYEYKEESNADRLFDFLVEHKGEKITKTFIKDNTKIVNDNYFSKMFKWSYEDLEEKCEQEWYSLVNEKWQWRTEYYILTSKETTITKDISITCSQWISNEKFCTSMKPYKIPLSSIPKLLSQPKIYSFSQFRDGHRSQKNVILGMNAIALDIDDNLSLEKAKTLLQDYKWWICTSRNHQKDKKWLTCDRYRVVLPIVEKEITNEILKWAMPNVEKHLFWSNWILDTSCFENARMFFWNPNQEVFELKWEKIMDIEAFYTKPLIKKALPVNNEYKGDKKNLLPAGTTLNWYDPSHYEWLNAWETVPCKCPNPAHEDKSNSAYVGKSSKTWNIFVKCSGCGMDPMWAK